jgi:hypothetical protein
MSNEPQMECSVASNEQSAQVVSGGGFMMIIKCDERPTNGRTPLWNSAPATAQTLVTWVARHLSFVAPKLIGA